MPPTDEAQAMLVARTSTRPPASPPTERLALWVLLISPATPCTGMLCIKAHCSWASATVASAAQATEGQRSDAKLDDGARCLRCDAIGVARRRFERWAHACACVQRGRGASCNPPAALSLSPSLSLGRPRSTLPRIASTVAPLKWSFRRPRPVL